MIIDIKNAGVIEIKITLRSNEADALLSALEKINDKMVGMFTQPETLTIMGLHLALMKRRFEKCPD